MSFPKIKHKCNTCGGSGYEDISYHGSPLYDTCATCGGDKKKRFEREMTTNEKLNYLLKRINKMKRKY